MENCLQWEGPQAGAEEECEESALGGGGGSGRENVSSSDHSPHFPCTARVNEGEKIGNEAEHSKKVEVEEDVLSLGFTSHHPTMI